MNMNNHLSTIESLPNEILMGLYEYFDGRELYNIFYNLNSRFNSLLRSVRHLSLYYQAPFDNLIDCHTIYSSQIHALNIYSKQNLKLDQFFNVHRLTLWFPTDEQIFQIDAKSFPRLEYLSVSYTVSKPSICSLYEKIFSNDFSLLKSCFLSGNESPTQASKWTQSPNLKYLHTTSINPSVLIACPNLYALNLILPTLHDISPNLIIHLNLKRLKLILTSIVWFEDEKKFEVLFSAMPNIHRLSLHKLFSIINPIDLLLNYDWLSTVIIRCLPLLKEFIYHVYIFNLFNLDQLDIDRSLPEIKENFSKMYQNQSEYFLKIKPYNT
ncbi:unnamed protein product [Rotaria socialis]|uniref:F-box domain-containing protein n=1 Tax=Rotaria socialis TaxID=392032 RepID=A0A820UE50_9BILA|nr:unnamed protein product [Rotaria socialis]CAF3499236.1 unnamed protein product [Rotaria socialis]CAF3532221.1 unnamed protein product [Rotaria socialis]CAF3581861.1 unnamed protein product [Rotaria socialis]CAF3670455.1 unnamed protein product [Rotaria socialis]